MMMLRQHWPAADPEFTQWTQNFPEDPSTFRIPEKYRSHFVNKGPSTPAAVVTADSMIYAMDALPSRKIHKQQIPGSKAPPLGKLKNHLPWKKNRGTHEFKSGQPYRFESISEFTQVYQGLSVESIPGFPKSIWVEAYHTILLRGGYFPIPLTSKYNIPYIVPF